MSLMYATVCSGIEAPTAAWEPLGWEPVFFSEIETFPKAVLAHRHELVLDLGDMTKIDGRVWRGRVDVLCAGTPCQSFSIAGLRRGLDDERGNLTLAFVKLCDDMEIPYVIWENVPGVLTDKTNAFGCFLAGLAGEDGALVAPRGRWPHAGHVAGPSRAIAWRVFDAQYFGVAQRRKRVFVVACAAASGVDPREILFESESVRRDSPPSRKPGQGLAGTIEARTGAGGFPGTDEATTGNVVPCLPASGRGLPRVGEPRGQDPVVAVVGTLRSGPSSPANHGKASGTDRMPLVVSYGGNRTSGPIDIAPACNAHPSASGRMDFETEAIIVDMTNASVTEGLAGTLEAAQARGNKGQGVLMEDVSHALNSANNGKHCSEDGTGRGVPIIAVNTGQLPITEENFAPPLQSEDRGHGILVPDVAGTLSGSGAGVERGSLHNERDFLVAAFDQHYELSEKSPTLVAGGSGGRNEMNQPLVFDTTQMSSAKNYSSPKPGDACHPLAAGAHPPAVAEAIGLDIYNQQTTGPVSQVVTGNGGNVMPHALEPVAFSVKDYGGDAEMNLAPTMRAAGHDQSHANSGAPPAVAFTFNTGSNKVAWEDEIAPTLHAHPQSESSNLQQGVRIGYRVRRLTPTECERLQGFPDDYTLVPVTRRKKTAMAADGPRYKAIGNSQAVPCVRWIGRRLARTVLLRDELREIL